MKVQKTSTALPHPQASSEAQQLEILPPLPNEVALKCLALLPRSQLHSFHVVSKKWHEALSSQEFQNLRASMGLAQEPWLCVEAWNGQKRCTSWKAFSVAWDAWRELPPVPPVRSSPLRTEQNGKPDCIMGRASGVVCGHLVVAGGEVGGISGISRGIIVADVFAYSPFTNRWHRCASMKHPCAHAVCGVVGGELYVLGGSASAVLGQCYNFERDEWRQVNNDGFHLTQLENVRLQPTERGGGCFYVPPWRTLLLHNKALSCSPPHDNGQVFSYDPSEGKWSRAYYAAPRMIDRRLQEAHFDSYFLHYELVADSWEVGKMFRTPTKLAFQEDNKAASFPSHPAMWTDVSGFGNMVLKAGALIVDGHRVYVLIPGLNLGIFQIEQVGIRCTGTVLNDERDYVVSCHLLELEYPRTPCSFFTKMP